MMHKNDIVVTLVDSNNKPFRELNASVSGRGRKCEVYAPVDTEYKFLIKNNTDKRIKVDIDVDGSSVTAGGLILEAHEVDYIERFVNIDRKFKTSLTTGEGVSDPTSPENGIIKVRVKQEKKLEIKIPAPIIVEQHHHHHHHDVWWGHNSYPLTYTSRNEPTYGGVLRGMNDVGGSSMPCSYSANVGATNDVASTCSLNSVKRLSPEVSVVERDNSLISESLATVEGGVSSQRFNTTYWNGEDQTFGEVVFTFFLKLAAQAVDPEYIEFLRLKSKFDAK